MALVVWTKIIFLILLLPDVQAKYEIESLKEHKDGTIQVSLKISKGTAAYGPDISHLELVASYEEGNRLHVHITDANSSRWEVPQWLLPRSPSSSVDTSHPLKFSYTKDPFTFAISRKSSGEVIFNLTDELTFKDQYLEISTAIPTEASIFGIGESTRPAGFRLSPNSTYTLWAADIPSQETNKNLYGSYPFYLDVRHGGTSHGVLLLNSNGMDIIYGGHYLTYKITGGILDLYFFPGPSPISVVQQLTELVGKPAPMPYWSLGFHQCRYGYKNVEELEAVVANYSSAGIPLEVMWSDIDYMYQFKDFTLDPVNYPQEKMRAFVNRLHEKDQKYVIILDPGIKPESNYSTFKHGKKLDIFVKDSSGAPYLGQVWPGPVYFPDFFHPKAASFWTKEIFDFHKVVPFDGLWIDMNEVSNFCTGITCSLPTDKPCPAPEDFTTCCLLCSGNSSSKWDNPPFMIHNHASGGTLGAKTMATSATHHGGILEYNSHNLYGLSEAVITEKALTSVLNKRPFILSRSTFVGSGRVTAHWSGDNGATWDDLGYSIVSILNSGLVGIPMVGADICGFLGNTSEELCNRWIQLGAFYPFSRNHDDIHAFPQELYRWETVTKSAKKALKLRYELLPHLYTLFYEAHAQGSPVARPVFFAFPEDSKTLGLDSQFMLGDSILVSPVLSPGVTSVRAYFPRGRWFNLFNYSEMVNSSGENFVLPAPVDTINVHLREGSILAMQEAAMTTTLARKTPFTLVVAFSREGFTASGQVFLDDGQDVKMELRQGASTWVEFTAEKREDSVVIKSRVNYPKFALKQKLVINRIVVLGLECVSNIQQELVNGKAPLPSPSTQHEEKQVRVFTGLDLLIGKPLQFLVKLASDT